MGVKEVLPLPGDGEKAFIAPDDLAGLGAEDDHGEGGVDHRVLAGAFDVVVQRGDEAGDLLLPPPLGDQIVDQQQQDNQSLPDGEEGGEIKGGHGKDHVDKEKHLHLGLGHPF